MKEPLRWEYHEGPDDPETAAAYDRLFDAMERAGRLADTVLHRTGCDGGTGAGRATRRSRG